MSFCAFVQHPSIWRHIILWCGQWNLKVYTSLIVSNNIKHIFKSDILYNMNILYIWIFIFDPAFQRIVNKTINRGIIKLQHLFQIDRSYASNPMILTLIKHQLFLTTFIRHSYHVTSIILLLFLKEISNNRYAAYRMNIFIIEPILKVFIVISNTLESISHHSP